jgi:thiosulfate/3-mercaptopyruvate sulfurtransferase
MAYVEPDFLKTTHGKLGCVHCHGGNKKAVEKEMAHKGKRSASAEAGRLCAPCHGKIVETYKTSLHATFRGAYTVMSQRAGEKWPSVKPVIDKACFKCHASCGGCHVYREGPGGGGLFGGHKFFKRPPIDQSCDGCHGGRIGMEYFGRMEGNEPDVHWEKHKMQCMECHGIAEFHGDGKTYPTRFERETKPSCLKCHPDAAPGKSKLLSHNVHGDKLSCYVCHSQSYINCYGCHVGKGSSSEVEFKIGKDIQSEGKFTTLRHVPTTRTMLKAQVPDAQPNYDALPTWTKAFPHNIRRVTKQNQSCNNCHGNKDIFLLKGSLDPRYPKANTKVAIEKPPERRSQ